MNIRKKIFGALYCVKLPEKSFFFLYFLIYKFVKIVRTVYIILYILCVLDFVLFILVGHFIYAGSDGKGVLEKHLENRM